MNYDIIGDIHGHAGTLEVLLKGMGYRQTQGAWRHLARQAIFSAISSTAARASSIRPI